MNTFEISGNQTAIKEILYLLDKDFVPPFICNCPWKKDHAHYLTCKERNLFVEQTYGTCKEFYQITYDGNRILNCKHLLTKNVHNLKDGCGL